jgi:hypothetical protein
LSLLISRILWKMAYILNTGWNQLYISIRKQYSHYKKPGLWTIKGLFHRRAIWA